MKLDFSKSIHYFYLVTMSCLIITICLGLRFFWQNGAMNSENINAIFEASMKIDTLKKKDSLTSINKLVYSDRSRDAIKSLETFDKNTRELHLSKEVDEYYNFKKSVTDLKVGLNGLISLPQLEKILFVLNNKVSNFEDFVVKNNWKTLTRMSKRVTAKLNSTSPKNLLRRPNRIKTLAGSVENDFKIMESVTEGSVLSNSEKGSILSKLSTLKMEISMLKKYVENIDAFNKKSVVAKNNYNLWVKAINPEISFAKIEFERNSKTLLYSSLIVVVSMIGIMIGGFLLYRSNRSKTELSVERVILNTVKNGVIPLEPKLGHQFSKDFSTEIEKYREYIHKRMSFGSVFQDAMPFSSILLDSNLNLVWGNSLFYDTWSFDEQNSDENLTWDYIQRFTNLGENDPVLSALHENIAGIYQIQVRTETDEDSLPYEMYVSPVTYAGQPRIMIIFYPLRSVEETLANQTHAIVGPVLRSLDALGKGNFTEEFKERISKDFDIAGINNVYSEFLTYSDQVSQQKMTAMLEIEKLENELVDHLKIIDDMNRIIISQKHSINKKKEKFNVLKQSIVSIIDLRDNMIELYQDTIISAKNLFKDQNGLLVSSEEVAGTLSDNVSGIKNISRVKDDFKSLKVQVDDFRVRIIQLLDQVLIFQKNNMKNSQIDQSLTNIKMEVRGFDKVLSNYSQSLTRLDVGLSKMELILSKSEIPQFTELKQKFESSREKIETDMFNMSRISRQGQMKDEEMIHSLKSLYACFKQESEGLSSLENLSKESRPDIQNQFSEV